MKALLTKLKEETLNAIPAIIYFLVALNLIHFASSLAREPGEIQYFTYLTMTIAALIIGKMLVIVNCFSFINAFPKKPLIYNIAWKLLVYLLCINLLVFIHIIVHAGLREKSLTLAFEHYLRNLQLPIFWATEILLLLTFFAYVVFSELVRVIGKKKMHQLLFG